MFIERRDHHRLSSRGAASATDTGRSSGAQGLTLPTAINIPLLRSCIYTIYGDQIATDLFKK